MMDKLDGKKGDIYNSVTEALYSGKEGITVVPVAYQREFLRWAPRGQGSGAPTVYKTRAECPEVKPLNNALKTVLTSVLPVGHVRACRVYVDCLYATVPSYKSTSW